MAPHGIEKFVFDCLLRWYSLLNVQLEQTKEQILEIAVETVSK